MRVCCWLSWVSGCSGFALLAARGGYLPAGLRGRLAQQLPRGAQAPDTQARQSGLPAPDTQAQESGLPSSGHAGPAVAAQGLNCSRTCAVFPGQGSDPCPLHWQADSLPSSHQGSPMNTFV